MKKVCTGNEAAAYAVLLSQPDVICAYPITPQSRIPEMLAEFNAKGLLKGKLVNTESEMGAISYILGASAAGVRVFTATSSQGLAWMHEGLHYISGSHLPAVMVNVNRPLAAPWNLTCDQSDSLAQRDTGWMQYYCESNQEVLDTVIQAYKVSESIGLPSMVCMDGVYLSYVSESVDIPDQNKVDRYIPPYRPSFRIPGRSFKLYERDSPEAGGYKIGGWDPLISLMREKYELHKLESRCLDAFTGANEEYRQLFGRGYLPVEEFRCSDAELVLVMAGSSVGTGKYVVNALRERGRKVGLVKLKMFRPFPGELIKRALSGKTRIVVIERDISPGQCGIFFQELKWALQGVPGKIYGFVSGLGGADITPALIEKAVTFAANNEPQDNAIWLGLNKAGPDDDYDRNTIKIS